MLRRKFKVGSRERRLVTEMGLGRNVRVPAMTHPSILAVRRARKELQCHPARKSTMVVDVPGSNLLRMLCYSSSFGLFPMAISFSCVLDAMAGFLGSGVLLDFGADADDVDSLVP